MATQPTGLLGRLRQCVESRAQAMRTEAIHAQTRADTEQVRETLVVELGYTHAEITRKLWETLPKPASGKH